MVDFVVWGVNRPHPTETGFGSFRWPGAFAGRRCIVSPVLPPTCLHPAGGVAFFFHRWCRADPFPALRDLVGQRAFHDVLDDAVRAPVTAALPLDQPVVLGPRRRAHLGEPATIARGRVSLSSSQCPKHDPVRAPTRDSPRGLHQTTVHPAQHPHHLPVPTRNSRCPCGRCPAYRSASPASAGAPSGCASCRPTGPAAATPPPAPRCAGPSAPAPSVPGSPAGAGSRRPAPARRSGRAACRANPAGCPPAGAAGRSSSAARSAPPQSAAPRSSSTFPPAHRPWPPLEKRICIPVPNL